MILKRQLQSPKMNFSSQPSFWLLIIPLMLASSYLVGSQMDNRPLNLDEADTIKHLINRDGLNSISETISSVNRKSPDHVPLYYLLLLIWADLVSLHFVPLRALSLFFHLLSISTTYKFTCSMFGKWHALYASCFVALSGYFIYYSQIMRNYALVVFLAISISWLYWRVAVSPRPNGLRQGCSLAFRWLASIPIVCFSSRSWGWASTTCSSPPSRANGSMSQ